MMQSAGWNANTDDASLSLEVMVISENSLHRGSKASDRESPTSARL
mgnify:CR=1 FL=1